MEATFVEDITGWRGDARLYRLSEPYEYGEEYVTHVIASAVNAAFSGPETYVFAATATGNVIDWCELPGSFRGGLDHERAIAGFCEAAA